jgi:uncharacterized protein (TIGR00255 family)
MKSMTGFGRGGRRERYAVTVEARSVNHRYLDVRIRTSPTLSFLFAEIQKRVGEVLSRGAVEIIISTLPLEVDDRRVSVNLPLAAQYRKALAEMKEGLSLSGEVDLPLLSSFRELFEVENVSETEGILRELVLAALVDALAELDAGRRREGEATRRDLQGHLAELHGIVDDLRELIPALREAKRISLKERVTEALKDAGATPDPGKLEEEVLYYLDRSDVSEELARAGAHLERFDALVAGNGRVGRELDFLCQELNREFNTVGSKGNDAGVSCRVVTAKSVLERIREQVQNVE